MTAKEYLNQIKLCNRKIEQRQNQLDELRILAYGPRSVNASPDKVKSSRDTSDKMADTVIRFIDMTQEINELIDEYVDIKNRIIGEIHALENDKYITVLYMRYVKYMKYEEIADRLGYTPVYIRELHSEAINAFAKEYSLE